ncbi:hypothetical protein B2J88_07930 [Rhodococcus sp. SRB_17]|nr:hypothetical protein [Rhodococcus sp. SRB_17]
MNINASESTVLAVAGALGRAALFDDRITAGDQARIAAWSEALEPYGIDQATMLNAVTAFYREPRDRSITVGDLTRTARDLRQSDAVSESLAALEDRNLRNDIRNGLAAPSILGELEAAPVKRRPVEGEIAQMLFFRRSEQESRPARKFVGTEEAAQRRNVARCSEESSQEKAARIVSEWRSA